MRLFGNRRYGRYRSGRISPLAVIGICVAVAILVTVIIGNMLKLWLDEEIYETGLLNTQIAERAKGAGLTDRQTIIADNAEMKSIAELNGLGLHVIPCVKGAGSIINGIDILKRYKLHITRRSVGIRREVVNYKWKIDKATGEPTNVPVDAFNHGLDAVRYVALKHLNVHKEARGLTRRN